MKDKSENPIEAAQKHHDDMLYKVNKSEEKVQTAQRLHAEILASATDL